MSARLSMWGVTVITTSFCRFEVIGVEKKRPRTGISPISGMPFTSLDSSLRLTPATIVVCPSCIRATDDILRVLNEGVSAPVLRSTDEDSTLIFTSTSSSKTRGCMSMLSPTGSYCMLSTVPNPGDVLLLLLLLLLLELFPPVDVDCEPRVVIPMDEPTLTGTRCPILI